MAKKMDFFTKCANANLAKILKEKGYEFFTKGAYNLNIIGVRSDQEKKVTNVFDDALVVVYQTPTGIWQKQIYRITTEPGSHYMLYPINIKGAGILVPGQYKGCWQIGLHNGKYRALVQKKPVFVYRDNNKDLVYDLKPETKEGGKFGINIHRSNEFTSTAFINKYSAGCQVFANPNEFKSFMRLCDKQIEYHKTWKNFTYTLLDESDLTIML
jgi:hypothetical protein